MTDRQAQHAEFYGRAAKVLALVAGKLRADGRKAQLDALDIADLFMVTAANIMLVEIGKDAAVTFLRAAADKIESTGNVPRVN